MIVVVPALTGVITPVEGFTVAIAEFKVAQIPPETVDVKVAVLLEQIVCVPDNVPAEAGLLIVTSVVAVALAHPPDPKTV